MNTNNEYDVVWPRGRSPLSGAKLAKRLDTLEGKVVAELWDEIFKGDILFQCFEEILKERYPGVRFINWKEFGNTHGAAERSTLAALPDKLKEFGADAVISGVGC